MFARPLLEVVTAIKNVAQSSRVIGIAHPIILNSPQAFVPDSTGTEVATCLFRDYACVDQRVECDADRLGGTIGAVEVGHGAADQVRSALSKYRQAGVLSGSGFLPGAFMCAKFNAQPFLRRRPFVS